MTTDISLTNKISKPATFSFEIGQLLRRGTTIFRIVEEYGHQCVIEHSISFERRAIQFTDLYAEYVAGNLVPCGSEDVARAIAKDTFIEDELCVAPLLIQHLSEKAQQNGLANMRYIKALRHLGYTCLRPTPMIKLDFDRLIRKFADNKPPSLSTIYAWSIKLDSNNGDWRAVFPAYSARGKNKYPRSSQTTQDALRHIFDDLRNNKTEKIYPHKIAQDLKTAITAAKGPHAIHTDMISRSTIERLTKAEFGKYEILMRNKGIRTAQKKYRDWYPRDRAEFPLEVVEFDDKDTRTFLIDDRTRLPI